MPQAEKPAVHNGLRLLSRLKRRLENWRQQVPTTNALHIHTLLGLMIGVLAGLVIIIFRFLVEIPLGLWLPGNTENFEGLEAIWHFWLPVLGASSLGLVMQFFNRRYQGTSVGHVLDRIHNHQGRLPLGNALYQLLGGAWCLVTGQSVGREGPAVHLGASCGSLLGQRLNLPSSSLRQLAGCGVAAAIAACFNTPMAGVIFAMEVVVMEYSIAGFIPVILAASTGTTMSLLVFGDPIIYFSPQERTLGSLLELPLVIIAGLSIALLAASYIKLQGFWTRNTLKHATLLRFTLAGIITGCLAYWFPQIMGVGYDTIVDSINSHLGFWLLLGILFAKILASSAAVGLGLPGGVIGPLLFIGACAGGIFGLIANYLLPQGASHIGIYVVFGMGAMMGATLNAPLAAIVAIIELTYTPGIMFSSMLIVVTACVTTRWFFNCDGLFEDQLKIQGKWRTPKLIEQLLNRYKASDYIEKEITPCPSLITRTFAKEILSTHPQWILLVEHLCLIKPQDIATAIAQQTTSSSDNINLMEIPARRIDLVEVSADATLYEVFETINQQGVDGCLIKTTDDVIQGVITRPMMDNFYSLDEGHPRRSNNE